jgi:hypothetical protein
VVELPQDRREIVGLGLSRVLRPDIDLVERGVEDAQRDTDAAGA